MSTNQRLVFICVNQSETSIILCQQIRVLPGGQDEDNVGQLLLARNVLFNDVFDHLDGLTGRIFEDGSQGVDGSVAWY